MDASEGAAKAQGPGRLSRALDVGAALVRHRDLLIQALELLRKAQAVTPRQEAHLVAAYDQGDESVRQRLHGLLSRLQRAHLGVAGVQLPQVAHELRSEGRAVLQEGRRELQSFLDQNRPSVEAVERASQALAEVGRELAQSLKHAGREAADELVKRGRKALLDLETDELERAFLDWGVRNVPRAERTLTQILFLLGFLFVSAGLLLGASWFPGLRGMAAIAAVVVCLFLGFLLVERGLTLRATLRSGTDELQRLAVMTPKERRAYLAERRRSRQPVEATVEVEESPGPSLSPRGGSNPTPSTPSRDTESRD